MDITLLIEKWLNTSFSPPKPEEMSAKTRADSEINAFITRTTFTRK